MAVGSVNRNTPLVSEVPASSEIQSTRLVETLKTQSDKGLDKDWI